MPEKVTFSFLLRSRFKAFTLSEASGSLGDLGTLLPLLIALTQTGSITLPSALFFAGVTNVMTGIYLDVPMCVQPMKSIAAIAIANDMSKGEVSASGVLVGLIMFILAVTNAIEVINTLIPRNVVSGLQVGIGLKLLISGITSISSLTWAGDVDCKLTGILCAILCALLMREPTKGKPPAALTLFVVGLVLAVIKISTNAESEKFKFFGSPVAYWAMGDVMANDWQVGFFQLALPQVPLTTLNSVVSVCVLANDLYPDKMVKGRPGALRDERCVISRKEVAGSVGFVNAVFCLFGAMPTCHGAGGLAAQHKFGARGGSSVIFLGTVKIFVAIFLGSFSIILFEAIPKAVLGVMLVVAGGELGLVGTRFAKKEVDVGIFVMLVTAGAIVALGKTDIGVLVGLCVNLLYGNGLDEYKKAWQNRGAVVNQQDRIKTAINDEAKEEESRLETRKSDETAIGNARSDAGTKV